jgi:mono/diheme cytochrome c family protein
MSSSLIRASAGALACAALALLGGCAFSTSSADTERGRTLFIQKCGSCHVLAQAATSGIQGPDLDAAFAQARANGMDGDTIEGVVATQIDNPRPSVESNPLISMPADLVSGQDLDDVAAYVDKVAGVPGAAPPKVPGGPGAQVFADNGCGGCHILAAANAGGTTGPDLDQVLPGQSMTEIEESIVDPNAKITQGYPPNLMPSNFGQLISPEDLKVLVEFLLSSSGGGGQ